MFEVPVPGQDEIKAMGLCFLDMSEYGPGVYRKTPARSVMDEHESVHRNVASKGEDNWGKSETPLVIG